VRYLLPEWCHLERPEHAHTFRYGQRHHVYRRRPLNTPHLGQASFIIPNGVTLTIYITGNISIAGGGIVNQGPPTDLIIYSSASKGSNVAISGNSDLDAVLYAPLSTVSVAGNSAIMGKVRGMTVTGSGNAGFHYDEATDNLLLGW